MSKDFTEHTQEQEILKRMQRSYIKQTIMNLEHYQSENCKYVRSILNSLASSLILYNLPSKVLYKRIQFVMESIPYSDRRFILLTTSVAHLQTLVTELKAYIGED